MTLYHRVCIGLCAASIGIIVGSILFPRHDPPISGAVHSGAQAPAFYSSEARQ